MPDLALADTDFPPGDFDFAGARVEHSKSGCEIVTMMKTAQPRHGNDFALRVGVVPCLPAGGCALCQSEVRPVVMVSRRPNTSRSRQANSGEAHDDDEGPG